MAQLFGVTNYKNIFDKIETWGWFYQHGYVQLLIAQIPKAEKDSQAISVFLNLWDHQEKMLLIRCGWNRDQIASKCCMKASLPVQRFPCVEYLRIGAKRFSGKIIDSVKLLLDEVQYHLSTFDLIWTFILTNPLYKYVFTQCYNFFFQKASKGLQGSYNWLH